MISVTPTYHLYIDDSGSRSLDKNLDAQDGSKWFALGGIFVKEEDEDEIRAKHAEFCQAWNIQGFLHSYDIRNKVNHFSWLNTLAPADLKAFYAGLNDLLLGLPVHATACVIDRKGYNGRYREKYGRQRWQLCKTAFSIVAERVAKFSHLNGRRLKVYFERCDKKSDRMIEEYYRTLRTDGMPFNQGTSEKYSPLTVEQLAHTLWDCKKKTKSSPLIQLADMYLFPVCVGGYDQGYVPFAKMLQHKRTINCVLEAELHPILGIKYSCFDK
jgi:hypothetical protein